jgi:UDP-2,3-diacylglucosamine pyrophosphatase LpxH
MATLQKAEELEKEKGAMTLDIDKDKLIIFSDLHKGIRDGADDFRRSERAYNAALAYYYYKDYTLVSLGDVEELWENRPEPVVKSYAHTLELEGRFHEEGRLWRVWGNHDDNWRYPDQVRKLLQPSFSKSKNTVLVRDAFLLRVVKDGKPQGRMLLLHGQQGTLDSEKIPTISRFFVRYVWRPIQRLTRISTNTPSKDWKLRQSHNIALYRWSEFQKELVLIAGHTHRPVFKSVIHEAKVKEEFDQLLEQLTATRDDQNNGESQPDMDELLNKVSEAAAELEWIRAQQQQAPSEADWVPMKKPSYFNTGCCSFKDGDITGIEISCGKISLVKWPNPDKRYRPMELESTSLVDVFDACRAVESRQS